MCLKGFRSYKWLKDTKLCISLTNLKLFFTGLIVKEDYFLEY